MKNILAWIATLIALLATVPYIIDIIKKRTKPNIVSWLTWSMLTGIAAAASFAAGEPRTGMLMVASTICSLSVLVLGLRYGIAKFSRFDIVCQASAVVGLVLWLVLNSPLIAIVATVTIDLIGALPTIRHSWLRPAEETWQTFLLSGVAATLTLLSLVTYSIEGVLYPIYLILANGVIVACVIYRRKELGISLVKPGPHETLHE